jgi:hypothetical protein
LGGFLREIEDFQAISAPLAKALQWDENGAVNRNDIWRSSVTGGHADRRLNRDPCRAGTPIPHLPRDARRASPPACVFFESELGVGVSPALSD